MGALQTLIVSLRAGDFPLVLLWLLTLAVVYGILSHISLPKSHVVRGVISIVAAFMVLFAAAAGPAAVFIENIVVSGIVIAFGLLIVMIFLELAGIKGGEHLFAKHPLFFGVAILILVILIFIGAGGLGIINLPSIRISEPIIAIVFFLIVMVMAIWILMKESKG